MTPNDQPDSMTKDEGLTVTRDDAVKFLESAVRNWSRVPRLSNDDLDDVAGALSSFLKNRRPTPSSADNALREALEKCRDQFQFYANEHRNAGKHEKAATNQRYAGLCASALASSPAAEAEPLDDDSLKSMIGELGNQIHNLGCEYQGDEILSTRLEELRSEAWRLASPAPVSPTPASVAGEALDWLKVAKLAGEYGIRYRTNRALEQFLAALSPKPTPVEAGALRPDRDVIAYSIIEGSAGIRAAEHAKDFQTANWTDALRSADSVIACLAALSQHGRGGSGGWLPIESAPKDGSEVLVFRDDAGVMLARYTSAAEFLTDAELADWTEEAAHKEDWFSADFVCGYRLENDQSPTHWMPLPSTPSSKERQP